MEFAGEILEDVDLVDVSRLPGGGIGGLSTINDFEKVGENVTGLEERPQSPNKRTRAEAAS